MHHPLALGLIVPLLASSALFVPAWQSAAPRADSTQVQLLNEVHQLRLALERQASVGARVQLISNRVGLQDERVYKLLQQLESVRREMMTIDMQLKQVSMRDKQIEDAIATETDPRQREDFETARKMFKAELALHTTMMDTLRTREQDLMNAYSVEQAKLDEVTRRLDELDRQLSER